MKIIKLNEANSRAQFEVSQIFVDGFYDWLKFFSKDREKLSRAFAHIFNADVFYIAVEDVAVMGFAACTNSQHPSIMLNKKEFRKHFGLIMGTIAYRILHRELETKPYPFTLEPNMGAIEFVATSANHRDKGVATALINYLHENTPFSSYVLEVADSNLKAINLYKKLGYQVFMKVSEKHAKQSGFENYLYMKYSQ